VGEGGKGHDRGRGTLVFSSTRTRVLELENFYVTTGGSIGGKAVGFRGLKDRVSGRDLGLGSMHAITAT